MIIIEIKSRFNTSVLEISNKRYKAYTDRLKRMKRPFKVIGVKMKKTQKPIDRLLSNRDFIRY